MRRPGRSEDAGWLERPEALIGQIAALGVRRLHIRGGDPFLEWRRLSRVLDSLALYPQLLLIVTSPVSSGAVPLEDVVAFASHPRVYLNVVLVNPHQRPDSRPGRAEELLGRLQDAGVRFSVSALLENASREERESALNRLASCYGGRVTVAEVRRGCEAVEPRRDAGSGIAGRTLSQWATPEAFYTRAQRWACLHGRFQIDADASVRPCAGIDERSGRMGKGKLSEALRGPDLLEWWNHRIDEVHPCGSCAMRYACLECAAVAFSTQERPDRCAFDPEGPHRIVDIPWSHNGFVSKIVANAPEEKPLCQTV